MDENSKYRNLDGKRLGFVGKGGSGKSTVAVFLSRAIRDQGYHVCLLDADSTNIGMASALGFPHSPESLLEYYGGMIFSGGSVTCPVDDPTPLAERDVYLSRISPKYYAQDRDITLLIAGKIGELGPGAGCDGPVAKIARDLRVHFDIGPSVTLVDFKAGFEDSARGTITSLDWVIVVVDPTLAAIEMASNMCDMVGRMRSFELPATMHLDDPDLIALANRIFIESKIQGVLTILNKVPDDETESYLRRELKIRNIEPIGVIYDDPELSMKWLKGESLLGDAIEKEVYRIVQALESRSSVMNER